ncbi:MAG TPA: GTP cyclohydrolase MptA [Ktedonobacteraceae bacterium]|nr:GTP cyclohydrolase MptA [Ktedonobacteraceae bacterium]
MSIDLNYMQPISHNGKTPVVTHTIFLALGSNLGDRRANLAAALQRLRNAVEISDISSVYETEPVGYLDQPRFLNMVLRGHSSLSPEALLAYVKTIEATLGRQATFRNGPRLIDIDILFYDDLLDVQEHLSIPHPRFSERAFVLAPLAEIAPDVIDPASGKSAQQLLDAVSQDGVQRLDNGLRISLEHDIQSGKPAVHVKLGRTGVTGITKAILIGNEGHQQWFNATFGLYAELDSAQAGVHMSRFSDALDDVLEETVRESWSHLELLAESLAKRIVEKQHARRAEVHIRTTLPVQRWTPVSGRPTQEIYGMLAEAVATPDYTRRMIGVEVEGMVACPCAQDMVHSYAAVRLQEEGFPKNVIEKMLSVTPLATHNQRGRATLLIGTDSSNGAEHHIDARDLIDLAESAMSSENYALLKRPDELYIVNKAHAHPQFVEDVARELLRSAIERYHELPDESYLWVHQRNEETIHKYDVEAEGWGTLGELRSEILQNIPVARHTSKEAWLG